MDTVKFKYYEFSYQNRESRILVPENISRFWAVHEINLKDFYPEITINGDREGIEALRDACAALSLEGCMAAYFPCRKNGEREIQEWIEESPEEQAERRARNFPLDLVLMNPNSLKISDWKKIRRRISKMKAGEWKRTFREEFIDMRAPEKYRYRRGVRSHRKEIFRRVGKDGELVSLISILFARVEPRHGDLSAGMTMPDCYNGLDKDSCRSCEIYQRYAIIERNKGDWHEGQENTVASRICRGNESGACGGQGRAYF